MKFIAVLLTLLLFLGCFPFGARAQTPAIVLVQHANRDAGTATSATLAFSSNNTAGNWIGVIVRAGRSAEIFTITDSRGNSYHRAVQFNVTVDTPNGNTLGIFYAENIAGGPNTITLSDSISGTLRFAIVEYSGVAAANSLDVFDGAQGNGAAPNSGNATTTSGDLLLGAFSTANSASFTAGSGFSTLESVPAKPGTKLFSEQQIKTIAGAESAHASLAAADSWGAVLAGFKVSTSVGTKPNITSLNPSSGAVGTPITITGTNFGTALGTVTFNGTSGTPTSWSATRVVVPVPSRATTGNVVLADPGVPSNGVAFTVTTPDTTPPSVTITSPVNNAMISGTTTIKATATDNLAVASVQFKVDGANSGPVIVSAPYTYVLGTTALSNGNHSLTAVATDTSGNATTSTAVTVEVNNTSPAPSITALNPTSGLVGASVTITGVNFGVMQGTSTLKFNGTTASPTSWSATSVSAPVPSGATTGNVVMTVGGAASNSLWFTVVADTTAPVVNITSPANNATISATISLTATATDANSPVSFVQFLIDGLNTGAQEKIAPYSIPFDTTTLPNGNHTLTAVAQDPTGNQGTSAAVTFTIANGTGSTIGPLKQSTTNSRYLVAPAGNAVFLSGSHTWNDFQDTNTNSSPPAVDFNSYVAFLKSNGQNVTILWHKDLPEYCGWNFSGSTWTMTPWPWLRPGPGIATDSKPKFDLTQFNQAYFDRLRARVQQLQQNGIYSIVQLFDGNQLTSARCSTDGYAFSGPNNINGVSDGYSSGASGTNSYTMTANNSITNFQDAYLKKVLDTLNDLPSVVYEVAEEQPAASMNWWAPHMMGLVRTYEAGGNFEGTSYPGKPFQHPVGIGSLNATAPNDGTLYSSIADWIGPTVNTNFSSQFPSNVSTNNRGKVVINDSDHSLGYKSFLNSDGSVQDQNLRGYLWENLTSGAEGVIFMDPYEIFWQGSPVRNTCLNPSSQVCTGGVDAKMNKFRASMGHLQSFANSNLNLVKMTPQGSLSSTGFCLADNSATGAEYVVYAPSGGTFTVNLSATTRVVNVAWFNPITGVTTSGAAITGGSTKSFTAPFTGDAVLYLVDAAGHN